MPGCEVSGDAALPRGPVQDACACRRLLLQVSTSLHWVPVTTSSAIGNLFLKKEQFDDINVNNLSYNAQTFMN